MLTKERLAETIAFRVTPMTYRFLINLAGQERRKMSEISTALLGRGIAAYKRDGQLFEPEAQRLPTVKEGRQKKPRAANRSH